MATSTHSQDTANVFSADLPDSVLRLVKEAAKQCRPIQAHVTQLTVDLLMVLCGARPAVLLDYTLGLTAQPLLRLVHQLNQLTTCCPRCCVSTLEACHMVVSVPAMRAHIKHMTADLGAAQRPYKVHLVGFTESQDRAGATLAPELLAGEKAKALAAQLAGLDTRLQSMENDGLVPPHMTLDGDQSLPVMPTLYGLMLGYPVVYCVQGGREEAARASRCLSGTTLTRLVLQVVLPPSLAAELGSGGTSTRQAKKKNSQGSPGIDEGFVELAACTVPQAFLNGLACADGRPHADGGMGLADLSVSAGITAWAAHVQRAACCVGFTNVQLLACTVEAGCAVSL